jgi:hypothetical protein
MKSLATIADNGLTGPIRQDVLDILGNWCDKKLVSAQ